MKQPYRMIKLGQLRVDLHETRELAGMDDDRFIERLHAKIERLTGRSINLEIDHEQDTQLQVELDREVPLVVMGSNVLHYSGFARM